LRDREPGKMWCDGHPRTEMPAVIPSKMEAKRGDDQRSGHGHRRRHREQEREQTKPSHTRHPSPELDKH
jgi:hypothetical protein